MSFRIFLAILPWIFFSLKAWCYPAIMNELSEDDFYTEIDRGAKDEGCLREDCEIAPDKDTHRVIRLPDIYRTEPTKIIKTYEKQITVDVVKHHIVEHVFH